MDGFGGGGQGSREGRQGPAGAPADSLEGLVSELGLVRRGAGDPAAADLLRRLHEQGRGLDELADTIVHDARMGLRAWIDDPERDPACAWGAERREAVEDRLARYGSRPGAWIGEVAPLLGAAGYAWHSFAAPGDSAGALDVERLRRIRELGGTLGHLASALAGEAPGRPRH